MNKNLSPVIEYLVHVLVGMLIFVALVIPAVGLSFLAKSSLIASQSAIIAEAFQWMSYLLLLLDVLLFLIFLVRASIKAFRDVLSIEQEGKK